MSLLDQSERRRHCSFFLRVGLLLPLALAAFAIAFQETGLDTGLSTLFYDSRAQRFLLSANGWAELLGHRVGKSLVMAFWLLLVAAAVAAPLVPNLAVHRSLLWTMVLAMALGPVVVTLLKDINTHACPWSLKAFGGAADYSAHWFVPRVEAGRCFPGGHASGGFSLVALAFAGDFLRRPGLRRTGLLLGIGVGSAFSLLRVAQGAHFMSHNLWAAAIDLWMAALVFSPLTSAAWQSEDPSAQSGSAGRAP